MSQQPFHEFSDELKNLINQFAVLNAGGSTYLEEDAFELLIDHFLDKEAPSDALKAAQFGLEQHTHSSRLMIKKADVLLEMSKPHEALPVLEKSYLFDRTDPSYYILKTEALLALDRQDEAINMLEDALQLFDGQEKVDLLFELTDVYDDYEQFDKVFDCLKLILELNPMHEEALYRICFWTDMTGRNEEGIRLHQQILEDYPFCELAWFNLGAAYQGIKLYEKSIDAYQYAVAINDKFDYAYRNMADAYIRLRKFKEAIEVLQVVVELTRPESIIYEAIGHCYEKLNNFAQARFYYKKALHVEPEDLMLMLKVATSYMHQENWASAIKILEQAIRVSPLHADCNLALGRCYLHLTKFEEAIQYLGNAVRIRPKNMAGWTELLNCFYQSKMYEEGYNCAAVAFEQTHGKPIFVYYKSAYLLAMGMPKQALIYLEHAIKANPKLINKFLEIDPLMLHHTGISEMISRYKKGKNRNK